tara:strand:- start:104 stop:286 length:183 start_codon:yes stop_codon:yes gene_type:complete
MTFDSDKRNIQKNYPQKKKKKTNNDKDHEIVDFKLVQSNNPTEIKCINDSQYFITENQPK